MTAIRKTAVLLMFALISTFFATEVYAQDTKVAVPELQYLEGMKTYSLNNGLKVILIKNTEKKQVDLYLLYKAGTRDEIDSTSGLAHLTEHTMYTGSKSVKPTEHDKMIKAAGGSPNAFTRTDYTLYYDWNMPPDKIELAIKLEADRMGWPRFDPKRFEWEKKSLMREEKGSYKGDVQVKSRLRSLAYERHPYRVGLASDHQSNAENITLDQCKEFHRLYYTPNNAVLLIVGDFDEASVTKHIKKYFGKIKRGPEPPKILIKEPKQWGTRRAWTKINAIEASRVELAFHIPEYSHKDTYALKVLANIIYARWMGMRPSVPENEGKGIPFRIRINVETNLDPGLMILSGIVEKIEEGTKTEGFLGKIIGSLMKNPPQEVELLRAKQAAAGIYASRELMTRPYLSVANDIGRFAVYGDIDYIKNYGSNIAKVTADDVLGVLRKYLSANNLSALYAGTDNTAGSKKVEDRARVKLGYIIKAGGKGMVITSIEPGGAADKAGLKVGDVITKILVYPVQDPEMYGMVLQFLKAGTKQYTILRNGKEMLVDITFEWKPQPMPKVWIGIGFADEPAEGGGLIITQIGEGGPAAKAGLKIDDIILTMGKYDCKDVEGLKKAVMGLSPGKTTFTIRRKKKILKVDVDLIPRSEMPKPKQN